MQEKSVVKRSAAEMFALIEKRKASNMRVDAFCKEQGIPRSAYYYWQKRYKTAGAASANPEDFIPVQISSYSGIAGSPSAFAEIILPGGAMIRLLQPVSPSFIQSLLISSC
jgi:hypothetical protein